MVTNIPAVRSLMMQRITAANKAAHKPAQRSTKLPAAVAMAAPLKPGPGAWRNGEYVTLQAASRISGVSIASLYRAASEGRLEFRRLEGRTLCTVKSLTPFVDNAPAWTPAVTGRTAHAAQAARRASVAA
jgi:hypothetical protein